MRNQKKAEFTGVKIVTGDTKVVEKGSADKIFINTSGVGIIKYKNRLSLDSIKIGDRIVINGPIADHGLAVLLAREALGFKTEVKRKVQALQKEQY